MNEKTFIKQHNFLTGARYEMSALQKDIVYMMIAQINDDERNKKEYKRKYRIPIPELQKEKNVRIRREEAILAAKKLISSGISIYNEEQKTFITVGILASAADDGSDLVLEFDALMYPFLVNIKRRFTTIRLQAALRLKSRYSKRLYEMLSQFKDTGELVITISELKKRLGLIDPNTHKERYANFNMFEERVLRVAQRELPTCTELSFTYTATKRGRKYTSLSFIIHNSDLSPKIRPTTKTLPQQHLQEKKGKYPNDKLNPDEWKLYSFLTSEVRWLKPKLAYKLVQTVPLKTLWHYIHEYEMLMKRRKERPSPKDFFQEKLELKNHPSTETIYTRTLAVKENPSRVQDSSQDIEHQSILGNCYAKMTKLGMPHSALWEIIQEIREKVKPEELRAFLEKVSAEMTEKEVSQSDNGNYLKERLRKEYNLSL